MYGVNRRGRVGRLLAGMFVDSRVMDALSGILVDPRWLLDLALTQAVNSASRGHLLAYNDEFVLRRLKSKREPLARCMACGCSASLREWYTVAFMDDGYVDRLIAKLKADSRPEAMRWLQPCLGRHHAQGTISGLQANVDAYVQEALANAQA